MQFAPKKPSRLSKALMGNLLEDYRLYGGEAIAGLRKNEPRNYLKLIAWLGNAQAGADESPSDSASHEELERLLQGARDRLARYGVPGALMPETQEV